MTCDKCQCGVHVFEAEIKTNPKTALELANADDNDD